MLHILKLGPYNTPNIHFIRSPASYLPKYLEMSLGHKHKHQIWTPDSVVALQQPPDGNWESANPKIHLI